MTLYIYYDYYFLFIIYILSLLYYIYTPLNIYIYIFIYLPHSSFRETSFHLRSTTFHRQLLRHIAMFSSLQPREASGTAKHAGIVGSL